MSGVFAKSKGARGEREVVQMLNGIIEKVLLSQDWDIGIREVARKCIQRNQNQSAVGGSDLTNVFGLSVEIKRQENLNINTWWQQTLEAAERNAELPVLIYRQTRQPWRVIMYVNATLPGGRATKVRAEIEQDAFFVWFYSWVYYKLTSGEVPRI